jgi:hypothetical protein
MTSYKLLKIKKSDKVNKKLMAIFENCQTGRQKTTHFGASGMSDFTLHKDPNRKKNYISRHSKNEDWNNPITAGALSRWILWNKTSLSASIAYYKKKFKFD